MKKAVQTPLLCRALLSSASSLYLELIRVNFIMSNLPLYSCFTRNPLLPDLPHLQLSSPIYLNILLFFLTPENFPLDLLELTFNLLQNSFYTHSFCLKTFLHFLTSLETWPSLEGIAPHPAFLSGGCLSFHTFPYPQKWTLRLTAVPGQSSSLSPNSLPKLFISNYRSA